MKVEKIMKKDVLYADINVKIGDVARLMKKHRSSYVILVNNNKAEGIITRTDIVNRFVAEEKPYDTKAKDIMSSPLIIVFPETEIEDVISSFKQHNIQRLVVIEKSTGRLMGIVDKDDVFKIISDINNNRAGMAD